MNKKLLKINLCLIILFIFIACTLQVFAAGSFSVSKSSTTITEGKTDSFTINGSSATGRVDITSSNASVATVSTSSQWLENNSATVTITAKKAGTATITISGTVADSNGEEATVTKTISVTVKAKATNTGGSSNSSSSSSSSSSKPSNTTTTAPKFTSVNQTMYTTGEVNVRASYSTSSAVIKTVEKGTKVTRTGIGDNGWSKVTYNGQTAYISSSLLTSTKPVVEENKVEKPKETNTTKNEETNNEIDNKTTNEENTEKTDTENNTEIENNTTTVDKNEKLQLSKLEIAGVNFSEGFNPEIYSYTLQLNFLVDNLTITAEANKEDAQVEIIGNENFVEGENNITILLNSADGKETVTYQITVVIPAEVATAPQNDIQFYLICGAIIIAAIVFIVVITLIYKKKSKNNDINDFSENKNVDVKENIENLNENIKPKKEKVKGGKHSN